MSIIRHDGVKGNRARGANAAPGHADAESAESDEGESLSNRSVEKIKSSDEAAKRSCILMWSSSAFRLLELLLALEVLGFKTYGRKILNQLHFVSPTHQAT